MEYHGYVHCNCFQKGEIDSQPPFKDDIIIGELGELILEWPQMFYPKEYAELEEWIESSPCKHDQMIVYYARLASFEEMDKFRAYVEQLGRDDFGTILTQLPTKNDGHMPVELSELFLEELKKLRKRMKSASSMYQVENPQKNQNILMDLEKLVNASIQTQNPISWC